MHLRFYEVFVVAGDNVIRSIGVSNYEITHIEEIKEFSSTIPAVNQVEFHPHFTRAKLKDYCDREGIFFQVGILSVYVCTFFGIIIKP